MSSSPKVRVLVIPGLYGSGLAHWQTWLQSRLPRAVRVEQDDWHEADLDRWSARIGELLDEAPGTPHVAVAHSFGCLALAHCLAERRARPARDDAQGGVQGGVQGALFVAPAEPERFQLSERLPLPIDYAPMNLCTDNAAMIATLGYYYAQSMYQRGGKHAIEARRVIADAILPLQARDGSWEGMGGEERQGGKIYATSLAVLSLAVKNHFLPIYQR